LRFIKVPQYTFSRVRRQYDKTTESEIGSGWSCEGLEKFNAIADMVKKDRELRDATFNSELNKVFKNTRKRKAKRNCVIDPTKQRPLIHDNMDGNDDSGQEDTNEHVSFVRVQMICNCMYSCLFSELKHGIL
jgi:hypothetical protein